MGRVGRIPLFSVQACIAFSLPLRRSSTSTTQTNSRPLLMPCDASSPAFKFQRTTTSVGTGMSTCSSFDAAGISGNSNRQRAQAVGSLTTRSGLHTAAGSQLTLGAIWARA